MAKIINNTSYRTNNTWYTDIFTRILPEIVKWIKNNSSYEDRQAIAQNINELLSNYAKIRLKYYKNGQFAKLYGSDNDVRNYQESIKKLVDNFLNNAIGEVYGTRYNIPENAFSNDSPGKWETEGLYGAITHDRTLLGWNGDYGDKFNLWRKQLIENGYDIELLPENTRNGDEAYRLRALTDEEKATKLREIEKQEAAQSKPNSVQNSGVPQTFDNLLQLHPFNFGKKPKNNFGSPFSVPIHLGLNLLDTTLTLKKQNTDIKVPLDDPAHKYASLTDAFAEASLINKQAGELNRQGAEQSHLTSDTTANTQRQLGYNSAALKIRQSALARRFQEYNQTYNNAINVGNENIKADVDTVNTNRSRLIAGDLARKDKLDKIRELLLKVRTDFRDTLFESWRDKTKYTRLVRAKQADEAAQNAILASKMPYLRQLQYISDPQNSQAFAAFKQSFITGANKNVNVSDYPGLFNDDGSLVDDSSILQWINNNPYNPLSIGFTNAYETEKSNISNSLLLTENYNILKYKNWHAANIPYAVSNQGFDLNYTQQFKKGGKTTTNLDYSEHNRKSHAKHIDARIKKAALEDKIFTRDLDAIDKETLQLLKNIFK